MQWVEDDLSYLTDPDSPRFGVRIAFTTRLGGESEAPFDSLNLSTRVGDRTERVERNRRRVEAAIGFPGGSMTLLEQVHGAAVRDATAASAGLVGEGDALVVRSPGVTATVLTADCVPVLLVGGEGAAAVHAGWRGLVGGVVEAGAGAIGTPGKAWIGPAIKACCYEVGPEVVESFRGRDLPVADERHVDPAAAAASILRRLGFQDVSAAELCVSCDGRFYSHRRDGVTGRQGGAIAWL